jgi:hypothetical protein
MLDPLEAVRIYDGRYQIEINFDEVKELGLDHYQGRSRQGVRRWPLFLSFAQMLLKFIATGLISVSLAVSYRARPCSWSKSFQRVAQCGRRTIRAAPKTSLSERRCDIRASISSVSTI